MCTSFSLSTAKPCDIRQGNVGFLSQKLFTARAELTYMPPKKQSSIPIFPELTFYSPIHASNKLLRSSLRPHKSFGRDNDHARRKPHFHPNFLEEEYEGCRNICAECGKTFYLDTLLMTEERRRAIWAIYVWCRIDELADGPNAVYVSSEVLERREESFEDIFDERPYDMLDAALTDTVFNFPLDIKPFQDMIEGTRTDTRRCRYANFQELYLLLLLCGRNCRTNECSCDGNLPRVFDLHSTRGYDSALYLGIGNQLTNILQDVGEDAMRGRVYLPQDELAQFGLSDKHIFSRKVTNRWRVHERR